MITTKQLRREEAEKYIANTSHKFDKEAQAVWAATSIPEKKRLLIETMINMFQYPAKAKEFCEKVEKTNSASKLDGLAADLMLLAHNEKVIK